MNKLKLLAFYAGIVFASSANATIVEVQTTEGSFQINLFDNTTPQTVTNFLNYVDQSAYEGVVFHRLVVGFVLQGGGYTFDGQFNAIEQMDPVVNEPVYSNVRGTIAMAKTANNPNSATNQWFINLSDNSANLDVQNGGFTVFGQVIGDGMTIVDQLFDIQCGELPLVNTTSEQCGDVTDGSLALTSDQLITINNVTIIDNNTETENDLTLVKNTLLNNSSNQSGNEPVSGSSGGALGGLLVLLSSLVFCRKRQKS